MKIRVSTFYEKFLPELRQQLQLNVAREILLKRLVPENYQSYFTALGLPSLGLPSGPTGGVVMLGGIVVAKP